MGRDQRPATWFGKCWWSSLARRLQRVLTAGAAKGRTPGSSETREGLRWAARGCKHWKIRNAERASWGRLIKPACQGNYLTGRQPEEGRKQLTWVHGPITGLCSYIIHLSSTTVLPPSPQPLLSSSVPLIFRNVSSKLCRKSWQWFNLISAGWGVFPEDLGKNRYTPRRNLRGMGELSSYSVCSPGETCSVRGAHTPAETQGWVFLFCVRKYMWTLNAVYSKEAVFSIMYSSPWERLEKHKMQKAS